MSETNCNQFLKILVSFTGKTYHESGTQGCLRHGFSNLLNQIPQHLLSIVPVHRFENRVADMLDRDVEIGTNFFFPGNQIQKIPVNPFRAQIKQAQPFKRIDL